MKFLINLTALFFLSGCPFLKKNQIPNKIQTKLDENEIQLINKIKTMSPILRVEVRNFLKDPNHPHQDIIKKIKKLKISLDKNAENYLELNFFANETQQDSPLIAQLVLFNEKSKNLIREDSLNLY